MQVNVPAGFWIRFITKIIDLLLPTVVSVGILFALLVKKDHYEFNASWGYYVWTLTTVILIASSFIVIPYFTKGRTLTMFVTRIKIVPDHKDKLLISLVKREAIFALSWIVLLLLAMIVINHTLVNDFARSNQKDIQYSVLDRIRIAIVSSAGTIVIVLQLLACSGIIIKKDKKGFHDRASETSTVWVKKFSEAPKEKYIRKIQPRPVNDEIVEWITE